MAEELERVIEKGILGDPEFIPDRATLESLAGRGGLITVPQLLVEALDRRSRITARIIETLEKYCALKTYGGKALGLVPLAEQEGYTDSDALRQQSKLAAEQENKLE
jgi:hypothetical protein